MEITAGTDSAKQGPPARLVDSMGSRQKKINWSEYKL
jgi:hypothetical protein